MLHNIMKMCRRDFNKIPILRKLLKVTRLKTILSFIVVYYSKLFQVLSLSLHKGIGNQMLLPYSRLQYCMGIKIISGISYVKFYNDFPRIQEIFGENIP